MIMRRRCDFVVCLNRSGDDCDLSIARRLYILRYSSPTQSFPSAWSPRFHLMASFDPQSDGMT